LLKDLGHLLVLTANSLQPNNPLNLRVYRLCDRAGYSLLHFSDWYFKGVQITVDVGCISGNTKQREFCVQSVLANQHIIFIFSFCVFI